MPGRFATLIHVAKNVGAPLAHRVVPRRGCYGADGDPVKTAATVAWMDTALHAAGGVRGKTVIELGPGRTPELLAAFLLLGARHGIGLDVNLQIAEDSTAAARYRALAAELGVPAPTGKLPLRFDAYDGSHVPLPPASADLVVSKSVLEHVRSAQVRPLLREMARVLRPGGHAVHIVDLRDHLHIDGDDGQFGDWLEALRYPRRTYAAMFSRRSTYVNRLRAPQWRGLLEAAGLEVVSWDERRIALPTGFDAGSLQPPWNAMAPHDLAVGHLCFAARRPA